MKVVNSLEVKNIDEAVAREIGIPPLVLMENAGGQVVANILKYFAPIAGKKMAVVCGKGNNGGDGLVIARRLSILGVDVKLFLLERPEEFKGAAMVNWQIIENLGLKYHLIEDDHSFYLLRLSLGNCDLIIDSIFGTGFSGHVKGKAEKIIEIINDLKKPILSVDVPSGIDASTGDVRNIAVKADFTVTFANPKIGLLVYPGCDFVGQLIIEDISIPQDIIDRIASPRYLITYDMVKAILPKRSPLGYKNTFGHVVTIGGSSGMLGAVALASYGAMRVGCGLATACIPYSFADLFDSNSHEILTKGLIETKDKMISAKAWNELQLIIDKKQAIVFGPGMGKNYQAIELLEQLLINSQVPVVIDADGLNTLAEDISILKKAICPVILTPHPGEMARLLQTTTDVIQSKRVEIAQHAARELGAIVVLKGAKTLIADCQGQMFINPTGNEALATAGSGDVLAGIIGGLLAQGMKPIWASVLGVNLHGRAGDLVSDDIGRRAPIASDFIKYLPKVLKALEEG